MREIEPQGVGSYVALLTIAFVMAASLLNAERVTSPTTDERLHVTRSVAWWRAPDTRLNWPQPPLGHIIAGAPASLRGCDIT